jgi:hypothetical protein
MIWPARKSRLPKARCRKTRLSTTRPTTLDAKTAVTKRRRCSGV